ncbi:MULTISPECIES: succinylglutamate desuccinylase/aspartoacylase family protein [Haloferax]|uniref:Succinylglutamate desuccinylase n=2 Tax=Haloferax TaxID=2251 RepID=A0A6G1Z2T9_9EURY|nr:MULTISPECIES: succinylglutamate desuccinylase/aspartoacylase family protein [Haloferax]KAB1188171.1 succinylglutamate desuccinylase [Haloferax sp. CBA1149]MRW80850.1 succinylglutamate desuccinylase [Haloferax marinisediminis]
MRIYELGDGTPEVSVVGSIHGDEPCGARAIERFVAEDPDVERPVKLIIANEEALDEDVRYLDEDLNRAFPGDPHAESHEKRLAHDLGREVRGTTAFSIHSTQSYAEPFAIVDTVDAISRSILPRLPVDVAVETNNFAEGRLIEHAHTVEVEAGLQKSDEAADNAYWLIRAFLTATNVLPAPAVASDGGNDVESQTEDDRLKLAAPEEDSLEVFKLLERIPKPDAEEYEVLANNFKVVEEGEAFARAGDELFTAEKDFYPILLSAYGYADIFGYAGQKVGELP